MSSEAITKNDLLAIFEGIGVQSPLITDAELESLGTALGVTSNLYSIINELVTPKIVTPSITTSTGTLNSAEIVKVGRVVTLKLDIKNSSTVTTGNNIYKGTIEQAYIPKRSAYGCGYNYQTAGILAVVDNGEVIVRCTGANLSANSGLVVAATYIV